jgi:hypothetical protein
MTSFTASLKPCADALIVRARFDRGVLGDFAVVAAEIQIVAERRGLPAGLWDAADGRRFKSDRPPQP